MAAWLLLAVACVWPGRALAVEGGYPLVDTYTALEVGADVVGLSGVQDANGVLYFGSNSLLSFDGDRWRSIPIEKSYALQGLDLGPDGRLWAASVGEVGWFERDGGAWRYQSLRDRLPAVARDLGVAYYALAYGAGAVFATHDRLLHWDGAEMRVWPMPGTRRVRALRAGAEIFVQHLITGLYVMQEGGPSLVAPADVIGDRVIFWMRREGETLLLLANDGLFRLRGQQLSAVDGPANAFLRSRRPTGGVVLPDGRLAVGTMEDGIAFLTTDGRIDSVLNEAGGLGVSYVIPLCVDRDGALWAGSRAAVLRVPLNTTSAILDARSALPAQPVTRLARHGEQLVLVNAQGLYGVTADGSKWELLQSGFFNDVHATPDSLLLPGYRSVTRWREGTMSVVYATDYDVGRIVPTRADPAHFYIADGKKIVRLAPDGTGSVRVDNLPDAAISLADDDAGGLWIGTKTHGVQYAAAGDVPRSVNAAESLGLPSRAGTAHVAALRDGTIVAFTIDGTWIRAAGATRFTALAAAPARKVTATAPDPGANAVWALYGGESGRTPMVARVSVDAGEPAWQPHPIEGMPKIGVPGALLAETDTSGRTLLWIGGTQGVLRHAVQDTPAVPAPRAPLVRATATIARDRAAEVGAAALPAATRSVHFEFALPEFGRRRALQLETRIDGVDPEWVPVGPDSTRELNLVRPGRYTVRARALAESGLPGAETVLSFEVLKPWWQTSYARTGAVLLIVVVVAGGYRFRVRTLRRRNAELETKVRVRTQELERASAAKTEFVANMSHDIRNPLNGIVGLAYALEETRLDERQREIVATLRECTGYLSTLVDDVLDFASIEAGRVELRPAPFNASELLGSIATTLKTEAIQSGADFILETDPALPSHLLGDPGRIQQILINFASNALKYAGGTIRLSATVPAHAAEEVEFAVADEGPGLSAAEQATLFTKFTRTAQARQHDVPGTGLGLAACRLLADIMGGSVGIISEPGRGACFYLRLPLVAANRLPLEAARTLPNSTVLLVEDTDYNAAAATAVLGRLGLRCERARTGEEALRLFSERRFNVVLLDRNLPDMDGTEVARRMRAMESDGLQSILLAVTAYCTAEDRARCIEAGMDAFVGKPLTPDKLRKVLLSVGRELRAAAPVAMHAETPPPTAPISGLDLTLLSFLADGTQQGLAEQVGRYVANLQQTERELIAAISNRDGERLANTAHRLLGDARMINATALAASAIALETAARSGALDDCPALLQQVLAEIDRVREALHHRPAGRTT